MVNEDKITKPRIKLDEPVMADSDIWCGDLFDRSKNAKILKDIICEESESLVVAVNGKWGCGKTFFLERFVKEYQNKENTGLGIYLNAWEHDYLSNPLLYVFSGIEKVLDRRKDIEFIEKSSWEACKGAISKIGWNLASLITLGLSKDLDSVAKLYPSKIYQEQIELVRQVKDTLTQLAAKVKEKTNYPLLICVDELDRCRPSYAIEMLERIKHFFNIPNIVFMLGIDRNQFCKSIQSTYGDIDTDNYLHRFIDIEFVLPEPDRKAFIESIWKQYDVETYLSQMDAKYETDICFKESGSFKQIFQLFAQIHDLTLREIQTALKWFVVTVRRQEPRHYSFPIYVAILILLRLRNRTLYDNFAIGDTTPAKVLDYILPIKNEKLYKDERWAFLMIIAGVYASFNDPYEETGYSKELREFIKDENANNQEKQMPLVIARMDGNLRQDLLERLVALSKHGFGPSYNINTLRLVRERLDFFL